MCEMLAISSSLPIKLSDKIGGVRPFEKFRGRSKTNVDGWGLAYYEGSAVQIFKEPIRAGASNLYNFLGGYDRIESAIYFVHVRETSVGNNSLRNTHPFSREHRGRAYAFAHNGTLKDFHKLPLGQHRPIGETDSEHAFCHLLAEIDDISGKSWTHKSFLKLQTFFQKLNRHGPFNCLFSDGEVLFCYHDDNGYNGLVYRPEKNPASSAVVVASKPLSDETWIPVNRGQLLVLRAGEKIY